MQSARNVKRDRSGKIINKGGDWKSVVTSASHAG